MFIRTKQKQKEEEEEEEVRVRPRFRFFFFACLSFLLSYFPVSIAAGRSAVLE